MEDDFMQILEMRNTSLPGSAASVEAKHATTKNAMVFIATFFIPQFES